MQNYGMNLHNSIPRKVKILVVDDYPNTASLLARSLLRLDTRLEVVTATSAQQALDCVRNGPVDILITDMDMPEMSGLELIEKLQGYPAGTRLISFLISASHTQELKIRAREKNVREVFHKPVHPEKIGKVVRSALEEMHEDLS